MNLLPSSVEVLSELDHFRSFPFSSSVFFLIRYFFHNSVLPNCCPLVHSNPCRCQHVPTLTPDILSPLSAVCHRWRKLQYRWIPNCFLTHISHSYLTNIFRLLQETLLWTCVVRLHFLWRCRWLPLQQRKDECTDILHHYNEPNFRRGMGCLRSVATESTNIMSSKYKGFMWKVGSRGNASGTFSKGARSANLTNAFLRKFFERFLWFSWCHSGKFRDIILFRLRYVPSISFPIHYSLSSNYWTHSIIK